MFKCTAKPLIMIAALTVLSLPALADGTNTVAWAPSYSGSCENCNLSGQSMSYWNLSGGHFPGADISSARMHGITARNTNFTSVNARFADLSKADLTGAIFRSATLQNARLQGVRASTSNFYMANLTDANLSSANFVGATLSSSNAAGLIATDADFSGANASGIILDRAQLTNTHFNGTNLFGSSFIGADITGASFRDARFGEANLSGMTGFDKADFTGACGSLGTTYPAGFTLPLCGGGVVYRAGKAQ